MFIKLNVGVTFPRGRVFNVFFLMRVLTAAELWHTTARAFHGEYTGSPFSLLSTRTNKTRTCLAQECEKKKNKKLTEKLIFSCCNIADRKQLIIVNEPLWRQSELRCCQFLISPPPGWTKDDLWWKSTAGIKFSYQFTSSVTRLGHCGLKQSGLHVAVKPQWE